MAALAERKKARAAAMSRRSLSMVSTRLPLRLMARYRYAKRPRILMWVSIDVPVPRTHSAPAVTAPAECLGENRREPRLPLADRLTAEDDAAPEEHLSQVTQGQAVAKAPEDHEGNHVRRVLSMVQQPAATLVELLAALTAAEPTVAPGRALRPLRHGGGAAGHTVHPHFPPR